MGRRFQASFGAAESAPRLLPKLHPGDFRAFGKIHYRKTVQTAELHENAMRGAVRISLKGHRPHANFELQFPSNFQFFEIDHGGDLCLNRTGYRKTAIGGNENIVHAPVHRNIFQPLEAIRVNHID